MENTLENLNGSFLTYRLDNLEKNLENAFHTPYRLMHKVPKTPQFKYKKEWHAWWDSNPRPQPPQGCALSTELQAQD